VASGGWRVAGGSGSGEWRVDIGEWGWEVEGVEGVERVGSGERVEGGRWKVESVESVRGWKVEGERVEGRGWRVECAVNGARWFVFQLTERGLS